MIGQGRTIRGQIVLDSEIPESSSPVYIDSIGGRFYDLKRAIKSQCELVVNTREPDETISRLKVFLGDWK